MFSLKMLSGTQGWRDRLIRLSGWIAIPPSLHCLLVPLINSDNPFTSQIVPRPLYYLISDSFRNHRAIPGCHAIRPRY